MDILPAIIMYAESHSVCVLKQQIRNIVSAYQLLIVLKHTHTGCISIIQKPHTQLGVVKSPHTLGE